MGQISWDTGTIKFYRRYVDDTLVLIKPCDIPWVLKKFNSFDKNLNFTVDKFEDGKVHFLDLEISECGTDIFRKTTHTEQYTNFHSFEPWSRKTAWIKSLFCRAARICSNTVFLYRQISTISAKFLAWDGFPVFRGCGRSFHIICILPDISDCPICRIALLAKVKDLGQTGNNSGSNVSMTSASEDSDDSGDLTDDEDSQLDDVQNGLTLCYKESEVGERWTRRGWSGGRPVINWIY